MRIHRIEAEGLFSYGVGTRRFDLDLSDGLTVILGPNGSGKSGVARLLNLVQAAVRFDSAESQQVRQDLWSLLQGHAVNARHRGMAEYERSSARISMSLSTPQEQDLLVSFVQAAVFSSLVGRHGNLPELASLEEWAMQTISSEQLVPMQTGTLSISHSGIARTNWEVAYEFEHEGNRFVWHLDTDQPNMQNVICQYGVSAEVSKVCGPCQRLTGESVPTTPPRVPDAPFTLSALLPSDDSVVRVSIETMGGNYPLAPLRTFFAAGGVVPSLTDPSQIYSRSYSASFVFSKFMDSGISLSGTYGSLRDPQSAPVGFGLFPVSLLAETLPSRNGQFLPARLYQMKNGDTSAKTRFEEVRSLFRQLAPGVEFDLTSGFQVNADNSVVASIQIEVAPHPSQVVEWSTPIELAGTGVEQALSLAEAIIASDERLLVLDEPGVNLHPEWQRLVRARLAGGPGQVLLITHSPYLVPTDTASDLSSIVRFRLEAAATASCRLSKTDLLDNHWISALLKEFSWSADAAALLFSSGVVLVEGPTELAALPTWFAKSELARKYGPPGDRQVTFYSVDGDQHFGSLVRYLDRFGVPWVIVCDGAAFRFDNSRHILDQVLAATNDSDLAVLVTPVDLKARRQSDLDFELFSRLVEIGNQGGIFTLALGWQRKDESGGDRESFEAFLADAGLGSVLAQARAESKRSKARQGRIVADSSPCPAAVNKLYGDVLAHLFAIEISDTFEE